MKQSLLKLAFAAVMLMFVAPFAGSQAVAQTHNLTGTVVDAQGNPVAGAAVVIDGTTKGTSTGSDGSFALNGVMANQSLLVTFIGYEPQTVAIGSQTNMRSCSRRTTRRSTKWSSSVMVSRRRGT